MTYNPAGYDRGVVREALGYLDRLRTTAATSFSFRDPGRRIGGRSQRRQPVSHETLRPPIQPETWNHLCPFGVHLEPSHPVT
jgi:hypothetical protein